MTLFMAAKFPNCQITAVSNSNSQREYILSTAAKRGFKNVRVFTGDICTFDLPKEEYYGACLYSRSTTSMMMMITMTVIFLF